MKKHLLMLSILTLLISSTFVPISLGDNTNNSKEQLTIENYNRYLYPEYYDSYSVDEIPENVRPYISESDNCEVVQDISNSDVIDYEETSKLLDGPPMDSPWPMYCHDTRHTGRSPYNTADNPYEIKWMFDIYGPVWSGAVIDEDGMIYIGTDSLYALYPNGTLKWRYEERFRVYSTPAIDENGVIYVGTYWAGPEYMWAINKNNGSLKWKFHVGNWITTSPAIGEDGSIYFGSEDDYIYALYPNGTLKWKYKTSVSVYSSPAIGLDGTIYCGSHNSYLYALYPNNGTLKWKYHTGDWVARGPSIADDGTIYFGSWDGYLYACYPNGTLKWKTGGYLAGTTPITGEDGTIYVGNKKLYAINPEKGTIKWSFELRPNEDIRGSTPCISADGTIYFGTFEGGRIYAVNNDGTEKWYKSIGGDLISAPAIGKDGTIYIGNGMDDGRLYAFGELDSNAPFTPDINGPTSGNINKEYNYTFKSTSPFGRDVYYYIEWGDGKFKDWFGPYGSGEEVIVSHKWTQGGTYTIRVRAKDTDNLWGPWGELEVYMPRDKATNNMLLLRLLERFPLLQKLLFLIDLDF